MYCFATFHRAMLSNRKKPGTRSTNMYRLTVLLTLIGAVASRLRKVLGQQRAPFDERTVTDMMTRDALPHLGQQT